MQGHTGSPTPASQEGRGVLGGERRSFLRHALLLTSSRQTSPSHAPPPEHCPEESDCPGTGDMLAADGHWAGLTRNW